HLGDVSDGSNPGQGDNHVDLADISLLGAHYGLSGAAVAPYAYLDVGPTSDTTVNGRPTTDHSIEFEDLMMFALNFEVASPPAVGGRERAPVLRRAGATQIAGDALAMTAPVQVDADQVFMAHLSLAGGSLQAISVLLSWNHAVVEPVSASGTADLTNLGGVA